MKVFVYALLVALGMLLPTISMGDNLQATLTQILWKPDRATFEIEHTIHLDDGVHLLAVLGSSDAELDLQSQARLLHYFGQRLRVFIDGAPANISAIGAEMDGSNLWIYQELEVKTFPQNLSVDTTVLRDIYPQATHQINLKIGTQVETLHLQGDRQAGQLFPNTEAGLAKRRLSPTRIRQIDVTASAAPGLI